MHRIKALAAHRDSGLYFAIMALLFAVVFFASALSTVDDAPAPTPTPTAPPVVVVLPTLTSTPTPTVSPSAPVPPTLTPPPQPAILTHVVQFGDTLYAISQRYGVAMDTIAASNNLPTLTSITVGQALNIPVDPVMATSAAYGLPTPNADGQIIVTATPAPNWMVNGVTLGSIFRFRRPCWQTSRRFTPTVNRLGATRARSLSSVIAPSRTRILWRALMRGHITLARMRFCSPRLTIFRGRLAVRRQRCGVGCTHGRCLTRCGRQDVRAVNTCCNVSLRSITPRLSSSV